MAWVVSTCATQSDALERREPSTDVTPVNIRPRQGSGCSVGRGFARLKVPKRATATKWSLARGSEGVPGDDVDEAPGHRNGMVAKSLIEAG